MAIHASAVSTTNQVILLGLAMCQTENSEAVSTLLDLTIGDIIVGGDERRGINHESWDCRTRGEVFTHVVCVASHQTNAWDTCGRGKGCGCGRG